MTDIAAKYNPFQEFSRNKPVSLSLSNGGREEGDDDETGKGYTRYLIPLHDIPVRTSLGFRFTVT